MFRFRMKKRAPRRSVTLNVKLANGTDWIDVTLTNVSSTGFTFRSLITLSVGDYVHIQHRGTSVKGEVVRVTATRVGVRSFNEIDVPALLARSGLQAAPEESFAVTKTKWWHWQRR